MKKMDCKDIQRKLSQYIDNRISAKERLVIESHIKKCVLCAAEKEKLEKLTTFFRKIPEFVPAQDSEELFWKKVQRARRHRFIEKIRSLITQWDFIPVHYPVAALFLIGLVIGIWFGAAYNWNPYENRLSSSNIKYLALDRMDTIPYRSFTGVYLSSKTTPHKLSVEKH